MIIKRGYLHVVDLDTFNIFKVSVLNGGLDIVFMVVLEILKDHYGTKVSTFFFFLAIEENRATVSFVEKANRNWVPVYVWTDDESRMTVSELGVSESLPIISIGGEKQSINSKRIIISIIIIMGQI